MVCQFSALFFEDILLGLAQSNFFLDELVLPLELLLFVHFLLELVHLQLLDALDFLGHHFAHFLPLLLVLSHDLLDVPHLVRLVRLLPLPQPLQDRQVLPLPRSELPQVLDLPRELGSGLHQNLLLGSLLAE